MWRLLVNTIALPGLAPLGVSKVLHLLGVSQDEFIANWQSLLPRLASLEGKVASVRETVFTVLFLRKAESDRRVPVQWFCRALPQLKAEATRQPAGRPISQKTVDNWRDNRSLHFNKWGEMDLDSAAAVLIAALVDDRERHFLPSETPADEPLWWCLSQQPPDEQGKTAPIIPRSIPHNLKPGTLIWSPWPSFQEDWMQEPAGGICFAGPLTPRALYRWDKTINVARLSSIYQENPRLGEQMIERIATSLLLKLSVGRLGVSPSLPPLWDSTIVWPREVVANN